MFELTKALGIQNIRREQMQFVADGVSQAATVKDVKLYRLQPSDFPSDDEVRNIIVGHAKVDDLAHLNGRGRITPWSLRGIHTVSRWY